MLQFLNNPGRLELTTGKLSKLILDLKIYTEVVVEQRVQRKTVVQNNKFIYDF